MSGIIEELQRGALDPNMPVDALLRRVQLAAVKLHLPSVESWVHSELNGYTSDLPDYRVVRGQLRGFNPYQGWLPVLFQETDVMEMVSTAHLFQSIGTLVDLVATRPNEGSEGLHYPLSPGMVNELNRALDYPCPRYVILLSRGNVVGILDRVRNMILDWAIRMEQQGIVGEGISFSAREKAQAQQALTTINIGAIGSMAGHIGAGNEGRIRASGSGRIEIDQLPPARPKAK